MRNATVKSNVIHSQDHKHSPSSQRVIGSYTTGKTGPTIVITAGLHGNEPAGTHALRRVFAVLEERKLPLRGKLLGLAGNLAALARDQRYVTRDLNRGWTNAKIAELLKRDASLDDSEDREQRELIGIFSGLFTEAQESKRPVVFLDVHSTSAGGSPFCAMSDTLRNRRIAFALPVPTILGLEETIAGTMLSYLDGLGHISVVFEGGQNQDPTTVDNDEAAIWITLVSAGALRESEIPSFASYRERLTKITKDIPHVVEVTYRHAIRPEDEFVMRPGYQNFMPIHAGEVLAHDTRGDVRCHHDSLILMPLYQKQGDDGYFVVEPVRKFWLDLSKIIRVARLDVLLPLMPGIATHPTQLDTLVVDRRVARWLVLEIFHLFGFRRSGEANGKLLFTRRRPEFRGIAKVDLLSGPDVT